MGEKSYLEWVIQKEEEAWKKAKEGERVVLPEDVPVERLPSRLQKEYRKRGYLRINKITFFSTKKDAFRLGFFAGALAMSTDEGLKWAQLNHDRRRRN